MAETPEWLRAKLRAYYGAMTEQSYLPNWAGESLGFHFGISDGSTTSLDESLRNMNALVAEAAKISEGERVLDAGCGVGGSSIWLARERRANVVGITIEPGQVLLATKFAAERGVSERAQFRCMDFAATDFGEASFDVVWNLESLCHTADPRAYFEHVRYLLRDGGRFACADLLRGDTGDPAHARAMCEGWVLPALRSREELAAMLEDLGFLEVTAIDLTPRVMQSAEALRAMADRRAFIQRVEREFAGASAPIYEAHVRAAIGAADGLSSGAVTYGYLGARRAPRGA